MVDPLIVVAVILAAVGNVVNAWGFIIQKKAHIRLQAMPPDVRHTFVKDKQWWIGLIVYAIGSLLYAAALAFGPAALLTPLQSFCLVGNVFMAPLCLKEHIKRRDIWTTVIIIIGTVLCVVFGPPESEDNDVNDLFDRFIKINFIIFSAVIIVVFLLDYIGIVYVERSIFREGKVRVSEGRIENRREQFLFLSYAGFSGMWSAYTLLLTKACSEIVRESFAGNDQFTNGLTYAMIILFCLSNVFDQYWKAISLRSFDALYIVPVTQVSILVLTIVCSGIYFEEFERFSQTQAIGWTISVTIVISAVYYLSLSEERTEAKEVREQIEADRIKEIDRERAEVERLLGILLGQDGDDSIPTNGQTGGGGGGGGDPPPSDEGVLVDAGGGGGGGEETTQEPPLREYDPDGDDNDDITFSSDITTNSIDADTAQHIHSKSTQQKPTADHHRLPVDKSPRSSPTSSSPVSPQSLPNYLSSSQPPHQNGMNGTSSYHTPPHRPQPLSTLSPHGNDNANTNHHFLTSPQPTAETYGTATSPSMLLSPFTSPTSRKTTPHASRQNSSFDIHRSGAATSTTNTSRQASRHASRQNSSFDLRMQELVLQGPGLIMHGHRRASFAEESNRRRAARKRSTSQTRSSYDVTGKHKRQGTATGADTEALGVSQSFTSPSSRNPASNNTSSARAHANPSSASFLARDNITSSGSMSMRTIRGKDNEEIMTDFLEEEEFVLSPSNSNRVQFHVAANGSSGINGSSSDHT